MMRKQFDRRDFVKSMIALPALAVVNKSYPRAMQGQDDSTILNPCRLKTSLNAFSFNDGLLKGSFSLDDLLEYAADKCFEAVDLTAYYFPGYPQVPPDSYLYDIKRKAFLSGLEISGTGIRNNFTDPDENKRKADFELIKNWIVAASKMGIPVIRVFAGQPAEKNYDRVKILEWMIRDIYECIEFGKDHGVVVGIQNHNDFIQTADQAREIVDRVKSDWFGLILDTGSFRNGDPYEEIRKTAPLAVNWQIKKTVFVDGKEEPVNLNKLLGIIRGSGYRGYLPIEILPPDDPRLAIPGFLKKLKKAMQNK